jgi:hypothetical protein
MREERPAAPSRVHFLGQKPVEQAARALSTREYRMVFARVAPTTVARIEQGAKKRFTLSGSSLGQVLRFVLAFLLTNNLLSSRIHLFTDGYKSLQQTILAFFAWHPG